MGRRHGYSLPPPKFRGYDTWLGYFHHSNDYWQYTVEKCSSKPVYDLWKYNETFDGPATFYQNGPSCSQDNQKPKNNETCVYEEEILTNEVLNIIEKHDVSTSLFLFGRCIWCTCLCKYHKNMLINFLSSIIHIDD